MIPYSLQVPPQARALTPFRPRRYVCMCCQAPHKPTGLQVLCVGCITCIWCSLALVCSLGAISGIWPWFAVGAGRLRGLRFAVQSATGLQFAVYGDMGRDGGVVGVPQVECAVMPDSCGATIAGEWEAHSYGVVGLDDKRQGAIGTAATSSRSASSTASFGATDTQRRASRLCLCTLATEGRAIGPTYPTCRLTAGSAAPTRRGLLAVDNLRWRSIFRSSLRRNRLGGSCDEEK